MALPSHNVVLFNCTYMQKTVWHDVFVQTP